MNKSRKPPVELTIIPQDHGGDYTDGLDCPIARALDREGVLIDQIDGYHVSGQGHVRDRYSHTVGIYRWMAPDEEFNADNAGRNGALVFTVEGLK